MSRTRIYLDSSGDIDMYDDISTPLTFNVADIREPEKRNSNYSKTIKIPNTKNNALLLGNIFEVNITDGSFNPNAKVKCQLLIDDEEQISGYLQLLNIIINDDSRIEYEVTVVGNVGNIFNALGNSELTDLDFSIYNHNYDYATQVASYTNNWGNGYCYPLIDYGFDGDLSKVNVEHLFPSLFLKTYIKKIFTNAGYTYESAFFDSAFFENLIVPCNSGKIILTDAQISPRLFEAKQTVQSSGDIASSVAIDVIFNNEINDPSGQYDPVTGEWTVLKAGYYNLAANGTVVVTATPAFTTPASEFYRIERKPFGSSFYNSIAETLNPAVNIGTHTSYVGISNVFLNAGDKVKCTLRYLTVPLSGYSGGFTMNGGTFKNTVVNSGLIEGDVLTINQVIPSKIKQKDLFKSVIKAFNLYIDVDKNNDRNLFIEPRDDFYAGGTKLDWSLKLDNSKPIEYRPMGDLDFKEFNYTYTDDTDYYNKKYKDTYLETYGRYRHVTNNEFLSGVSETKIIFSPTPLVGDSASDRVISRIWDVDSSNVVKAKAFNIRLLYRGGVKTSNVSYEHIGRFSGTNVTTSYLYAGHVDNPVVPTLDLCFGVPQEVYYFTSYYTNNNLFNKYHKRYVDEITDRNSKIVTAYFYLRPSDIRNLDFRNEFWFENAYFRLNKIYDYDPLKHEVTKCEFIKIKEYATFSPTLHSLLGGLSSALGTEFAPVLAGGGSSDVKDNVIISGGAKAMQGGEDNILNDNLKRCIILGDGNVVGDSENVSLIGSSGDIIGSGGKNITLINSSGDVVNGGLKNVVLINTNDVTVSSGDILMINNHVLPTITAPYAPIKSVSGSSYSMQVFDGTLLVTTGASDTTINLNFSLTQFLKQWVQFNYFTATITQNFTKIFNIKKVDSGSGRVIVTPVAPSLIDGSATAVITSQYNSITIQYDGTNWHII